MRKAGLAEGLRQLRDAGGNAGLSIALDSLATLILEEGDGERGAILASAAERLRSESGGGPNTAIVFVEDPLDRARRAMSGTDFERASAIGRSLGTDAAIALALEIAESASDPGA